MQIITKLKPHDDYSLAIGWEVGEDPIYRKLLSDGKQWILHINDNDEVFSETCIEQRLIPSKLLKECFWEGAEVVISNCCPQTKLKDNGLYLWHCEEESEYCNEDLFNKVVNGLDIHDMNPDALKFIIFLLQENKYLVRENYRLREENVQLEENIQQLKELVRDQNNRFLFSNRRVFTHWISEKMAEIERGSSLLQRNFPRRGLEGSTKFHVDYLFQDGNRQHLLIEVLYYDRRLRQDPMTNICCLKQAQEVLSKELSINTKYIRTMILTNELSNGLADLCTINQIELVCITGDYSIERLG